MNIRLLRISLMLGVGLVMLAAALPKRSSTPARPEVGPPHEEATLWAKPLAAAADDTSLEWRAVELRTPEGGNSHACGLSSRGTVGAELMPGGIDYAVL